MTNGSSQPTLEDVVNEIKGFRQNVTERLDKLETRLDGLDTQIGEVKEALKTLDSRFFDFSMRVLTVNSSAYWTVAIALLSAAITFVVARTTGGTR